jgi:hypothetical protein
MYFMATTGHRFRLGCVERRIGDIVSLKILEDR